MFVIYHVGRIHFTYESIDIATMRSYATITNKYVFWIVRISFGLDNAIDILCLCVYVSNRIWLSSQSCTYDVWCCKIFRQFQRTINHLLIAKFHFIYSGFAFFPSFVGVDKTMTESTAFNFNHETWLTIFKNHKVKRTCHKQQWVETQPSPLGSHRIFG